MSAHKLMLIVFLAATISACGQGNSTNTDEQPSDTDFSDELNDTSTEAGRDSESEMEDSETTAPACLGSMSGRVLKNGETGLEAYVAICLGNVCLDPAVSKADGTFVWSFPVSDDGLCELINFEAEPIHFEIIPAENPDRYAGYSFFRRPTQADISDQGPDDVNYDLGDLSIYELPAASYLYDPTSENQVDLSGVRFVLPAESIVKRSVDTDEPIDHTQEIYVFEAPLDTWTPPFVDTPLEALYFISPSWAKLAGDGVALSIEPTEEWADGETRSLYLLGRYSSDYGDDTVWDRSAFIYRTDNGLCINTDDKESFEKILDGEFVACGTATLTDGRIETTLIPRFTWIGIAK